MYNYIITRLDYCNSLYYELPGYQLKKLQLVFNGAARFIIGISLRERITPVVIDLHWLPIEARIVFKICVLTYIALNTGKPVQSYAGVTHSGILLPYAPIRHFIGNWQPKISYLIPIKRRHFGAYGSLREQYTGMCDPGIRVSLRHSHDPHRLNEPRMNKEIRARSFRYRALRLFNSFPRSVKDSENLKAFKKRLKT